MKKEKDYLKPYKKRRFFKPKEKKLNRSMAGNTLLFVLMAICGVAMVLPLEKGTQESFISVNKSEKFSRVGFLTKILGGN